jgi:hypothetical protein
MNGVLDSVLSYRDGGGVLTLESMALSLLSTFALGQAIAWIYVHTHRGVSYSGTLARSLVILALIVALVMMVIGNNIARAFGLFGALALIRFRTPVKDANDTVFLFLAVAIGIATGTGNILAGVVGTVAIGGAYLYLARTRFGSPLSHDGLLRFRLPVGHDRQEDVGAILARYCERFDLLHIREAEGGASVELAYQIKMDDTSDSPRLTEALSGFPDLSHCSLLIQDTEAAP